MTETLTHRLVLPADSNHHGTLYAGSLLRIALEAGYATAWTHVGPRANLVLRRVHNLECLRPVPVGAVIALRGAVLHRASAYLVTGLVGAPLEGGQGPWLEALLGFAQVDPAGRPHPFPEGLPAAGGPPGDADYARLGVRLGKLLRVRARAGAVPGPIPRPPRAVPFPEPARWTSTPPPPSAV